MILAGGEGVGLLFSVFVFFCVFVFLASVLRPSGALLFCVSVLVFGIVSLLRAFFCVFWVIGDGGVRGSDIIFSK